ncbi:hypothetical protein DMO16_21505 [Fictibacillus sp. S7]|nr:hypothetical protein DMO16_21505 [Fictibacillus sp. S7]
MFRTFLHYFKKEFKNFQPGRLNLGDCGILLYADYHFLLTASGAFRITAALLLLFLFCYSQTVLFFFPVFVHYELDLFGYIKTAFLIGMMNLHTVFFMAVGLGALVYLQISYPGFLPFFGAVSPAILIMAGGCYGFNRMKRLQLSRTAPGHR